MCSFTVDHSVHQSQLKENGSEAFKAQHYEAALQFYTDAIRVDPVSDMGATLYSNRAAALAALGKHDEALMDCDRCIRLKRSWFKGHYRKGVSLEALGRLVEAQAAYDAALQAEPESDEVRSKLNDLRARMSDSSTGANAAVLQQGEWKRKGTEAFKAQRYQEAILCYTKAIDIDPMSDVAGALYSNRAAALAGLGNHEGALMDCDRCIRVEPAWLKGHYRKGTSLEALGRLDEAQAAYESALQAEPSNTDVRKKLNELTARTRGRNPPRGESLVFDTCALMELHPRELLRIAKAHTVIIPFMALSELDGHMKGGRNRPVALAIRNLLDKNAADFWLQSRAERDMDYEGRLNSSDMVADDRILACAVFFRRTLPKVRLVTNDKMLRVKASAEGIPTDESYQAAL
jgi:tetratricopeptide (TPR) repeat protein